MTALKGRLGGPAFSYLRVQLDYLNTGSMLCSEMWVQLKKRKKVLK